MTTGKLEMTRLHSAPRRREREPEAALGDAPILLSLPSLCGVPDPADEVPTEDSPETHYETSESLEPTSTASEADLDTTDAPTLSDRDDSETSEFQSPAASTLAKPAYSAEADTESESAEATSAPTSDAEPQEAEQEAEEPAFEDDDWTPPVAKSNMHRNIIVSTALFVIMAAGYMYVNRDDSDGESLATPAVDVEMGWELEGDSFANESVDPNLGPAYGTEFQAPPIDGPSFTQENPLNVAPLPSLNEAASSDFEIQRVGVNGNYPTTSTPDAPYVAENPAAQATGPSLMPMGNSPMTPQEAPNDQPY